MQTRNELTNELSIILNRVKTFSCPEFKDIYTKVYFQEVVTPAFTNTENSYAFIFGDFNKLGVINDIYGHNFGDKALEIAMRIIKKSVPKDAIIVRAGGDEIYILLSNSNKEFAEKYSNLIQKNLQKNAILIGGLSIELASADSTYGDIDTLMKLTDNEVTNIKAAHKGTNFPADILADDFIPLQLPKSISSEEKAAWEELNNLVNISIYKFLQNFRPSKNFEFKAQQIVDSSDFVTNSFIYLLNKKLNGNIPKSIQSLLKEDYPYMPDYNIGNVKKCENILDSNIARSIHLLLNGDMSIEDLNNLSDEKIKKLINSSDCLLQQLVRDNTGLLNKQYFRLFLAKSICNSIEDFAATYVSFSGLKLSNFAYDHTFSDNRLNVTNQILCNETAKFFNYTNDAFNFSNNNIYFLSQAGGNYLYLYPKSIEKDIKPKIDAIINEVNSKINIKDPNSSFQASYYSMDSNKSIPKNSPKDVIEFVRALKEEANSKKIDFKKDLFKSADAYFAFRKSINNCVDYYLENIKNGDKDTTKLIQFIKNVYTSFLNQEVLHNNTRHEKHSNSINDYDEEEK